MRVIHALEQILALAVARADLLFDVAIPKVGGQTERAVRSFVQGDIVGPLSRMM